MKDPLESIFREHAPRALATLMRRYGQFDSCEDALQEALLAASHQWRVDGIPAKPSAWLYSVASRRLIEHLRKEAARRRREEQFSRLEPESYCEEPLEESDDVLKLMLLCCHPSLTRASQIALTLRAVGGLTTAEIARAFMVPEATISRRITRAKQKLRDSPFSMPESEEFMARLSALKQVLYLIFNEGYTGSAGTLLYRDEHAREAIRLTRTLHGLLPSDGEIGGLLALMLLTHARRPARVTAEGRLIPLESQDRRLWDRELIAEGIDLITTSLQRSPVGPYQIQAAIAALHCEAESTQSTDWNQIVVLYDMLKEMSPSPMIKLNRTVAFAMAVGSAEALAELKRLEKDDPLIAKHYRTDAIRAHLLERVGELIEARACYERAAQGTLSIPEREYLRSRAEAISSAIAGAEPKRT